MIERPRDKAGDRYEYFTCSGRRRKRTTCTRSAILAGRIEEHIETTYGANGLTPAEADRVREVLHQVFDQLEASSEDERKLLEAQKEKLEAERLKLVQAHYADAIPLDLLKSEQERIRVSLDKITARLDMMATTYASAREGLDEIVDLLTDLGDLYNRCEPAERRMLNRALFDRLIIDEDENVTHVPAEPAASVLTHVSSDVPAQVIAETNLPRHQAGQVSIFSTYVDLRRFELLTSSMRTRRATNCAIGPDEGKHYHRASPTANPTRIEYVALAAPKNPECLSEIPKNEAPNRRIRMSFLSTHGCLFGTVRGCVP